MQVIIGKNSGFCAGVKYTITNALNELEKSTKPIYCFGEIIHNKQVVENLENQGLITINNISDAKEKVLIRAHGTSKDIYHYAKEHNIELIDLTCPKVLKIHDQVINFSNNNYFIFLFGIKNHPETIGTYSFCGNNSYLIENSNDIVPAIEKLKSSKLKNVLVISQTTFSIALFDELLSIILEKLEDNFNVNIQKSICNATELRQIETSEISSKVDLMIVIGGENSSNTKKLAEVSKKNCKNVLHVQTKEDLDLNYVKRFDKVGIVAGASTPSDIIEEIAKLCISL